MIEKPWQKIIVQIERYIPMKLGSLFLFLSVLYFIFIVGRSIYINHEAYKEIEDEEVKVIVLREDILAMNNQINYLSTYSFREKEARAKLGYKAVGEKMIAVPIDQKEEKMGDSGIVETMIKIPNYINWWRYFVE